MKALERLAESLGERTFAALLFGVPAVVIGIVTLLVTGDLGLAIGAGVCGSALLMVGLMGYAEGSAATSAVKPGAIGAQEQQEANGSSGDAPAMPYDERAIFEQDGWRCALCGQAIEPDLTWPDPRSPNIDLVVPISLGGSDTPRNVQAAHLACSELKRRRLALPGVDGATANP